jgi:hypothetical protein
MIDKGRIAIARPLPSSTFCSASRQPPMQPVASLFLGKALSLGWELTAGKRDQPMVEMQTQCAAESLQPLRRKGKRRHDGKSTFRNRTCCQSRWESCFLLRKLGSMRKTLVPSCKLSPHVAILNGSFSIPLF